MLPSGAIIYTGVVLNAVPQITGSLPFNQAMPVPGITVTDPITVSIPGGLDGATILLQNKIKNVAKYAPTLDGRIISEQVGLYGTVVYQSNSSQNIISVVLPPDVAQFIGSNPPLKAAASVLEALLTRIETWSKEGFLICSRVMRAIAKIIGGYRNAIATSRVQAQTVELHTYMANLKRVFLDAALLFGARANEAIGKSSPLILDSAKKMIDALLGADGNGYVIKPFSRVRTQGDSVYIPEAGLVSEQLDAITKGVLVSSL